MKGGFLHLQDTQHYTRSHDSSRFGLQVRDEAVNCLLIECQAQRAAFRVFAFQLASGKRKDREPQMRMLPSQGWQRAAEMALAIQLIKLCHRQTGQMSSVGISQTGPGTLTQGAISSIPTQSIVSLMLRSPKRGGSYSSSTIRTPAAMRAPTTSASGQQRVTHTRYAMHPILEEQEAARVLRGPPVVECAQHRGGPECRTCLARLNVLHETCDFVEQSGTPDRQNQGGRCHLRRDWTRCSLLH